MNRYIRYGLISVAIVLTLSCCLKASVANDATKHYNDGLEQYKKGWYDQAIKEFEKAIELKSDYVSAYYALGNSYYCKHLYDKAVKEYHKVLRYDPDHAKAHYALWLCYRALGMTGDADRELDLYKKLSGQEVAQKEASSSSSPSEKRDHTSSEERTTSWHTAESQTPVEAKAPPKGASHTETKETHKKESHRVPEKQPKEKETVEKPAEADSHSQTVAHVDQKQKESAHTEHHEQPAKPKEEKKEAAETHKQVEAQETHPTQPVAQKQPSVPVTANAAVEREMGIHPAPTTSAATATTPQPVPTPLKAEEQVQASPPQHTIQSEAAETKAPASNQVSTAPGEVKKPHIVVERPLERVRSHGIKVRLENLWNSAPMGKVIVSILIYIFAAQVWITTVAMLGLFFYKKR